MRVAAFLFAISAAVTAGFWAWLGSPIAMPQAPLSPGEKIECVSYAPFRGAQTPLDPTTVIPAFQIDEDLGRIANISNCVRTYSVDMGLDRVAELAAKYNLTVLQGLWLSSNPVKNREQIEGAVSLANRHNNIRAVIVGNEVLLRGEMLAADLANIIREVKSRVRVQVTYADVWEFWLRNPVLNTVADFVTIHILPYWEDLPIPAQDAGTHVASIRRQVATAFPGREILIGEVGWPSAGRMREGALPSPANQARVIQDVIAIGKRENWRVNVIEAFDQPWKRNLEGTVGGHWGFLSADRRELKFAWGEAVSNHPHWKPQAVGGVLFAALVFAAAFFARRGGTIALDYLAVAAIATSGGTMLGWSIENLPIESLGAGGWLRSVVLISVAFVTAPLTAAAISSGRVSPSFAAVLNRWRGMDALTLMLGVALILLSALAVQIALGLVFDPRYRDFPFAPFTAAVLPFAILVMRNKGEETRGIAEMAMSAVLLSSVIYIVPNESLANWQSLWLGGLFALLALTLLRARGAPG